MPIRKTASVKGGQHVFAAMSLLTTHSPLTHSSMSCRTHFSSLLAQGTLNKISFFSVHRPEVNEEVGLLVTSFHTCQRPSFTKRAGRVVPLSHGRRPRKHALHATVVSAFMHAPALCAHILFIHQNELIQSSPCDLSAFPLSLAPCLVFVERRYVCGPISIFFLRRYLLGVRRITCRGLHSMLNAKTDVRFQFSRFHLGCAEIRICPTITHHLAQLAPHQAASQRTSLTPAMFLSCQGWHAYCSRSFIPAVFYQESGACCAPLSWTTAQKTCITCHGC